MTVYLLLLGLAFALTALGLGYLYREVRRRGYDRWLIPYIRQRCRRRPLQPEQPVHLLLCIADHYEPDWGKPSSAIAQARVDRWVREYPRVLGQFRDSDGRPPRHSFFYPLETYNPAHLDALAELCRGGFGEVEVHLHHDHDSPEALRRKLLDFKETLAQRHGLLCRHRDTGELAYGFIHGNWALDNSRPDGRWCGVNNELDILRETGCYADFTLPSAPSPTQTRKINSLYYAVDDPHRPRSHDWGTDVGVGPAPVNSLLMIQGPLIFDWTRRRYGLVPKLENGCIQSNQPLRAARLDCWLRARVQVASRPDWFFVKLYTHGAKEANADVLLGESAVRFHEALAQRARDNRQFHYHYVTAREMANLVRAAEAGWMGSVAEARDFQLVANQAPASVRNSVPGSDYGNALCQPGQALAGPVGMSALLT
jgi:hypothetical protein